MSALAVDLYALTMVEAYLRADKREPATFSVYVRDLPPNRGYLISAGLATVVDYLRKWRFSEQDLEYLAGLDRFARSTLDYLERARFEGDLRAMPEGGRFFAKNQSSRLRHRYPSSSSWRRQFSIWSSCPC